MHRIESNPYDGLLPSSHYWQHYLHWKRDFVGMKTELNIFSNKERLKHLSSLKRILHKTGKYCGGLNGIKGNIKQKSALFTIACLAWYIFAEQNSRFLLEQLVRIWIRYFASKGLEFYVSFLIRSVYSPIQVYLIVIKEQIGGLNIEVDVWRMEA